MRGWTNRKDDPDFEQRAHNVKRVLLFALEQGDELEQAAREGRVLTRKVLQRGSFVS